MLYMLKCVLGVQEAYDDAVVHRRRPLRWMYLIRIKAKDVDIEPRFLSFLPDRLKTRKMCEAVKDLRLSKYVLY